MLCKRCGFGVSSLANFCPKCGEKVDEHERIAIHSQKGSGKWLKILLGLIFVGLVASFLIFLFSDHMTETVSDQLEAIKENELTKAYYSYTSRSFQDATPLATFHEFMEEYPVFANHKSVRFIDRNSSNDKGFLHAMIMSDNGDEIPVEYQLVKENDKWLINSIKLDDTDPEEENDENLDKEETFNSAPLKQAIHEMMDEIKKGNLKNAYDTYTSTDFQKITSFQDFENFVKNNTSFSQNKSLELDDLSFDNNMATITGKLTDDSGKMYSAEYDLVEENGEWKIFHVKVWKRDPNQNNKPSQLVFSKFVLGSGVNDENLITDPTTVFKAGSEDIYLNLYLDNVVAGTKIEVVFEHTDTNSKIPPVSKRVLEKGSVILAFIFTPPKTGWPEGNYRITASSSTGETNTYEFKVE